ncbi:MAG: 3,4-dihydroxy-2-butanone-4-phosphate synthase [Desulfomonilaceae bacterium]
MGVLVGIEEAVEEIRQGRMVILVDDADRENEGDLTMTAEKVTSETVNFMTKYARGLLCLPRTPEKIDLLGLPIMVSDYKSQYGTAFTVSIEAAKGPTTGSHQHGEEARSKYPPCRARGFALAPIGG